eukprot:1180637-Prorocentrum_minimum.AAC.2
MWNVRVSGVLSAPLPLLAQEDPLLDGAYGKSLNLVTRLSIVVVVRPIISPRLNPPGPIISLCASPPLGQSGDRGGRDSHVRGRACRQAARGPADATDGRRGRLRERVGRGADGSRPGLDAEGWGHAVGGGGPYGRRAEPVPEREHDAPAGGLRHAPGGCSRPLRPRRDRRNRPG